jgi:hypothetical protein
MSCAMVISIVTVAVVVAMRLKTAARFYMRFVDIDS